MNTKRSFVWACLAAVCVGAPALGHDFWIEATPARVEPGQEVRAALRVGMACPGEPVTRKPERIERFVMVGPGGAETALTGEAGADPAGAVRTGAAGLHAVVYRGKPVFIELAAAEFESYLREEGLERVIALRKVRGESDKPGKEVYSRCAKALVAVGEMPSDSADRATGLRFELVAQGNPMSARVQEGKPAEVVVTALFEGRPLTGAQVKAMHCAGTEGDAGAAPIRKFITDEKGRATVTIDRPGRWVLASTEMIEAPAESGAAWESLWASLVFEVEPASRP